MTKTTKLNSCICIALSILGLLSMIFGVTAKAGILYKDIGTSGLQASLPSPVVERAYGDGDLSDVGNRKYTILELFGNSAYFSVPYGETKGNFLRAENKSVSSAIKDLSSEQKQRLEEQGKKSFFVFDKMGIFLQTTNENIVGSLTLLVRKLTNTFFDGHLICGPDDTGGCIDLVGMAGGKENSDGGLIGNLGRGVFLPLSTLAFLFTAIWLIYTGIVKRSIRQSFGGVLWAIAVFVLGVMIIYKPWIFARMPQEITSGISSCMLNVLNGGDCLQDREKQHNTKGKDPSCEAYTNSGITPNQYTQFALLESGCNITKGFTIDNWTRQQFGYSYDELFTKNAPKGFKNYPASKLEGKPEDYCVNMYSPQSPKQAVDEGKDSMTMTNQVQVCNIALTYMANATKGDYGNKAGMVDIVATAAKDPRMWSAFIGDGRDTIGFMNVVGAVAVTITFVPIAVFGLAYSFLATILIMFAPVFLLFAIHPGKGKKMFLGWLESLISSILKYFATGILMIIMITVYQTIFKTLSGTMIAITSIILMFVFIMYRKEITNMIGEASLGGRKVANKLQENVDKKKEKAKHLGTAVAGGAVGGALAGDIRGGIKQGVGMELRRGRGTVANAARSYRQVSNILSRKTNAEDTGGSGRGSGSDKGSDSDNSSDNGNGSDNGSNSNNSGGTTSS